ncbi:MAG: TetR/AcrR family transcriptional regulator [Planctomycetes bacterium]|nr:TetR/AcrR family transcriptional regulator [Planctomycetota bacterium]
MPANLETVARTRSSIEDAAVRLFTKQGFHGTGMRQIATEAGVSLGNLYNYHKTKHELFAAICEAYEADYTSDRTPIAKALKSFASLDDLERLGEASRQTVRTYADYIRLIYVDVVELEGEHIRRLFKNMRARYEELLGDRLAQLALGDVDPIAAIMTATISYFYLFNIEYVFGVKRPFGTSDKDMIGSIATVLREGMRPR